MEVNEKEYLEVKERYNKLREREIAHLEIKTLAEEMALVESIRPIDRLIRIENGIVYLHDLSKKKLVGFYKEGSLV